MTSKPSLTPRTWTFLSNHAHVLMCLTREPNSRVRDVAVQVGMTERGVLRIFRELEEAGVIRRYREGRRNRYEICFSIGLRHPLEADCTLGGLFKSLLSDKEAKKAGL